MAINLKAVWGKTPMAGKAAVLASGLALGGCAHTPPQLNTDTCMEGSTTSVVALFAHARAQYVPECATAQMATLIASIKRPDGTTDPRAQAIAIQIYRSQEKDSRVRQIMDQMLEQRNISLPVDQPAAAGVDTSSCRMTRRSGGNMVFSCGS